MTPELLRLLRRFIQVFLFAVAHILVYYYHKSETTGDHRLANPVTARTLSFLSSNLILIDLTLAFVVLLWHFIQLARLLDAAARTYRRRELQFERGRRELTQLRRHGMLYRQLLSGNKSAVSWREIEPRQD